jgi:hypothetical protein
MSTPIGIAGISRVDTKQTDLTVAEYNGQARSGEMVIDLTNYNVYVANLTGTLFPISGGGGGGGNGIVNGTTSVAIPSINSDILISVDGISNVGVITKTDFTLKANLIPDANNVFSLGNLTNQWKDLYLSNSTLYFNGLPISVDSANNLTVGSDTVVTSSPTGTSNIGGNLVVAGESILNGNASVGFNLNVAGNLALGGLTNLNSISNVTILGGTPGQYMTTDGNGNLSWTTISSSNGTSNVNVPIVDGNVDINSNGVLIASYSDTALTVSGNLTVDSITSSGNITSQNYATPGNIVTANLTVNSNLTLPNPNAWVIPGGNIGDVIMTNGNGGISWQPVSGGGGSGGSFISNIASNVVIPTANGNVFTYINGTMEVQIGQSETTFYGDVIAPNVMTDAVIGQTPNTTINSNNYITTFSGLEGNVEFPANIIVSNTVYAKGIITNTSSNLSGDVVLHGNVTLSNGATVIANVTSSNLDVYGTLWTNVTANLDSLVVRGVSNLGPVGNLRVTGGLVNQVLTSNGSGGVSWSNVTVTGVSRIANGSSYAEIATFDGPVILRSSSGVIANVSDALYITGNTVIGSNLIVQQGTYLGPIANVRISGGSPGQVLTTNGSSGLSWLSVPGVSIAPNIANGTSNIDITVLDGNIEMSVNGVANVLVISDTSANLTGIANVSGDIITAGNINISGNASITQITSTATVQENQVALGAGSSIDVRLGAVFTKTISAATTFSVTGVPSSGKVGSFILELTNGGSSAITWWGGIRWAGGTAPSLTSAGVDILGFYTFNGGTTWNGLVMGRDMQ